MCFLDLATIMFYNLFVEKSNASRDFLQVHQSLKNYHQSTNDYILK